jgi:hypothetical protein
MPCINVNPVAFHVVLLEPPESGYVGEVVFLTKFYSLRRSEQPDDLFEVFRPFEHGASTIFLCHVEQSTVFAFLLCPLLGRFPLCIYFIE